MKMQKACKILLIAVRMDISSVSRTVIDIGSERDRHVCKDRKISEWCHLELCKFRILRNLFLPYLNAQVHYETKRVLHL